MNETERAQLKSKIDSLQTLYGVLFVASLVALGARWMVPGFRSAITFALWALLLAGAVFVRLYRTSLVNRYNASIQRGPLQ
jgi:hypothetical protein